jgi:uncharacterized membrane protein required for colicin V production
MTIINFGTFGIGIVDIILVIAAVIFAILGWKHGFLVKVVQMASGIFGIIGSIIFARPFAGILDQWIGAAVGGKINEYLVAQAAQFTVEFTYDNRLAAIQEAFPSLPTFLQEFIAEGIKVEDIAASLVETVQPVLKDVAMLVIAFITLFLGSIVVFFILKLVVKGITKIPVIREIDKILGVLFGLVKIFAIVLVLFFVLGLLMAIPAISEAIGPFLAEDMGLAFPDQFRISKWIYDHNLLKDIINVFLVVGV